MPGNVGPYQQHDGELPHLHLPHQNPPAIPFHFPHSPFRLQPETPTETMAAALAELLASESSLQPSASVFAARRALDAAADARSRLVRAAAGRFRLLLRAASRAPSVSTLLAGCPGVATIRDSLLPYLDGDGASSLLSVDSAADANPLVPSDLPAVRAVVSLLLDAGGAAELADAHGEWRLQS